MEPILPCANASRRPRVSENYVLDASALLRLLQDEKGAERVAEALPDGQFSEAFGKLVAAP
jgi:hypothetical protein